ncbi:peptidase, M48 family [Citrifermentans bemidjiense Bem]|uniref:Peptidase, M48 family n=1 Tax=Citrifermentans bemidjiense (strain ATCC BAA-1014 / DSM 16622 / JCM 12645 / Bem) TaxID=404380 RepID=B5ECG8_CITBB|nr:M48 family metallopeptidase [Citrifermentans bemidjiense]ACH37596.1 peptidase, M48 family [Citrifermentans bemidjiense Bem]
MKTLLISLFLVRFAVAYLLRYLNLRHLKRYGTTVPEGFAGAIDQEALAKSARYTLEQHRVGLVESIYDSALLLVFLFTPLLPLYDHWIASLSGSYLVRGLTFMLLIFLSQSVLEIPFSLYSTFRLERRYGFNTTTPGLWLSDFFKSMLISALLAGILVSAALLLVRHSPELWWLWVWGFFALFSITMIYLSPYVIEPLFSKFEPLSDPELEAEIRVMLDRAGIEVKGVLQMDASRRSLHSNAYFTGIGHVKRIVLYDTLLKQMDHQELLTILAHETGHWKKGHIWKQLLLMESVALAAFFLVHQLIGWGGLPGLFGHQEASFPAQVLLVSFILSIASFPFTPVGSWLSRRNEREADRFAVELSGAPHALASALVKLSCENLSNLHPHPLYAGFYYSHPPVVERVAALRAMASTGERRNN